MGSGFFIGGCGAFHTRGFHFGIQDSFKEGGHDNGFIEGISQEVSGKLFAVLKNWSGDYMDAFRYECFARRLIAAEHGRPDAVEWAMNWYNDVVEEERQAEEARQRATDENEERKAAAWAELRAGRCGNPNYQAFLDTLEHPEQIENNAPYFAWMSELRGRFESTPGLADMAPNERGALWQKMIREKRDANLAPRLKMSEAA